MKPEPAEHVRQQMATILLMTATKNARLAALTASNVLRQRAVRNATRTTNTIFYRTGYAEGAQQIADTTFLMMRTKNASNVLSKIAWSAHQEQGSTVLNAIHPRQHMSIFRRACASLAIPAQENILQLIRFAV